MQFPLHYIHISQNTFLPLQCSSLLILLQVLTEDQFPSQLHIQKDLDTFHFMFHSFLKLSEAH